MIVSMVMAIDRNQLIGANGKMPWRIPSDLQYFKRITMGKPVIMGRRTYESIGRPLPGRANIVVTRNEHWFADGVQRVDSLADAFATARQHAGDELMVIGGASLCSAAMQYTQRLYLTVIDHAFEGGDTWLDSYQEQQWHELSSDEHDETEEGGYRFAYKVLERKKTAE